MEFTPHDWKTGEVIIESLLDAIETALKQVCDLATTNESDIDTIDHLVHTAIDDSGHVIPAGLANYSATTSKGKVPRVKADGTGFDYVDFPTVPTVLTRSSMTATVPSTLSNLRVSHLSKMSDGTIPESVFDLTNGGTTDLAIDANTAFATGLTLAKSAKTYDCLDLVTGNPYTLSVNSTGTSMAFTTDVSIKANSSLHVYVRANG